MSRSLEGFSCFELHTCHRGKHLKARPWRRLQTGHLKKLKKRNKYHCFKFKDQRPPFCYKMWHCSFCSKWGKKNTTGQCLSVYSWQSVGNNVQHFCTHFTVNVLSEKGWQWIIDAKRKDKKLNLVQQSFPRLKCIAIGSSRRVAFYQIEDRGWISEWSINHKWNAAKKCSP